MKNKKEFSIDIAGKTLTLEVSSLAEQTNAAVLAKYGETVVLATAVAGRKDVDLDYLPLKVDYEEKYYAAGKIIGSRLRAHCVRPLAQRDCCTWKPCISTGSSEGHSSPGTYTKRQPFNCAR